MINGEKQRIITHESREWVWEIERLKDREREKELRCKLLFTIGQFQILPLTLDTHLEVRVSGEQTPNAPNLVYSDRRRKFPPQEGRSRGAIYRRGYPR